MWKLKIAEGGNSPYIFSKNNFCGRQIWEFDPEAGTDEEKAQVEEARRRFWENRYGRAKGASDLLYQFQFLREKNFKQTIPRVKIEDGEEISYEAATAALRRSVRLFTALQATDGHWCAENSGVNFYFPPLNEDGGWGLHIEGHSMMFCTVLNYIQMRLLGEGPDGGKEKACERARKWILDHGGATSISSWGKTWLAILGVYEWDGCNPMPPEFFVFPTMFPMHPGKMFCYCRLTFMPMSYLYGKRFVGSITPLLLEIRQEIYNQPYSLINWSSIRHLCAPEDNYYPHGTTQKLLWDTLHNLCEPLARRWPFSKIRDKALKLTMDHIHYEDVSSCYITIGCVEKPLNMLACWVDDPNGDAFKKHLARIPDYLWMGEDGMKMQV
ncbi:Lupeol synthase [Linum grandiflorum]